MADMEELIVRIRADASQLEREFKKAQGIVTKSSSDMSRALADVRSQVMSILPALSVAAVVAFGKSAFAAADHLNDLALRTGIAGSTLSALNIKLLQGGSSVDDFAGSINRMNNLVGEAAKGLNQEAIKAFDDLGLSVRKLSTLSPEDQFYEIAAALGDIDNQAAFTNAGMAIFGRSFSNLAPLIKEANGNLREYVDEQKRLGEALSEEELKRIDEYGDRITNWWERAKLALVDYLLYFENLGRRHREFINDLDLPEGWSRTKPVTPSDEDLARGVRKSLGMPEPTARGSNKGLLKNTEIDSARKSLEKYNQELKRQHELSTLAPRDAAGMKAYYDTLDLAQKAGVKNAEALAQANADVARSNYDLQESMQESARFAAELKDQFAETAGNIIFDSKNAADAVGNLTRALARMVAQRYILGPLSDSLFGTPGSGGSGIFGDILGGIGSSFGGFFADGGTLRPGQWGIAGENGPEPIYAGSMPLSVTSNKAAGKGITIENSFYISAGVQGTVRAELMAVIPSIIQASKDSVFGAIQRGGPEARIVGQRS